MYKDKNRGFTLVEMMVVVAIIAILAAIAIPNYQRYVVKSRRADAMAELQNIGMRINSRKIVEGVYSHISLAQVLGTTSSNGTLPFPQGTPFYNIRIINTTNNTAMTGTTMNSGRWRLEATPLSTTIMNIDGKISYDVDGEKCRDKNKDGTFQTAECGLKDEWKD